MRDAAARRERSDTRSAAIVAPARARRGRRGAALWTTIGFVCGAVFWHAVGFWNFVGDIAFNPNGDSTAALSPAQQDGAIVTGSLPSVYRVNPASCTSLELDRQSNRTVVRPCPGDGLALRLDAGNDREDLALAGD
ncbi:MAG: hypothetical protein Q8K85_15410 [Hyphomicrobium sp.]|nr:hypothetical protein [Hyphomicrobium sp.]